MQAFSVLIRPSIMPAHPCSVQELEQRDKVRRRRAAGERRAVAAEAKAVAAVAAAKRGPTASELLAMPRLDGRLSQAELEEGIRLQVNHCCAFCSALEVHSSDRSWHLWPTAGVSPCVCSCA